MDDPIYPRCITHQELVDWLNLVERDITKPSLSKSKALTEPADPPGYSRAMLAIVATVAGSVTFAWTAFLLWMVLKAVS